MFTTVCCLVARLGLVLGLDLVSGWLVVTHTWLLSVDVVKVPYCRRRTEHAQTKRSSSVQRLSTFGVHCCRGFRLSN